MSGQYVHTASVNHIGSTHADRMSWHPPPANHHSDTLPLCGHLQNKQRQRNTTPIRSTLHRQCTAHLDITCMQFPP